MRILLTGNSPFCQTGYGVQPAQLALQLKAMGHEPAIFAYYGLSGSLIEWQGIPVYPNNTDDYGIANVKGVYEHFKADCIITLCDVWVLGTMPKELKWFPWTPIDHEPIPPNVKKVLTEHPGIYKPIAMSRYGESEMKRVGIDCFYVPHMINCQVYSPSEKTRKTSRQQQGWEDKFVIGQVGTNVRERKNWTASFLALQKFYRKHQDVVMYCHTDAFEKRGRDLQALRESLMIQDITRFPSITILRCVGIPDTVMASMYNSLDVLLQPSKGEGFGIPIIEAQACGVPVIVANNTSQPELVGGGWVIKKMQPQWDEQSSWEGAAEPDEIYQCLEQAYHEKKSGKIAKRKIAAREMALQYDIGMVMERYWKPVIAEVEKMVSDPKYLITKERGKVIFRRDDYRQAFIPASCGPKRVIDIGCGPQASWKPFLDKLGEYTGIDIASGDGVIQMDAVDLKFPDKHFGFAWCCDVLEHVEDPLKVVKEAKRVAEHGVIIFCTPQAAEFKIDPEHKEVKIEHALTKAGHGIIIW